VRHPRHPRKGRPLSEEEAPIPVNEEEPELRIPVNEEEPELRIPVNEEEPELRNASPPDRATLMP
jgi:hypothetical protein